MRRSSFPPGRRRSPVSAIVLLLALLVVGFLLYLGFAKGERPLETMEQDVTNAVPAR